jgi:hypothetical protein
LNGGSFSSPQAVDYRLSRVATPLIVDVWDAALKNHPDRDYAKYITAGLRHGFRIGVDPTCTLSAAKSNMLSVICNPMVVEKYLEEEVLVGNILGPFSPGQLCKIHINRFGHNQPGKWCLITDLSHSSNASINDAIDPQLSSLSYIPVDQIARRAMQLGGWCKTG